MRKTLLYGMIAPALLCLVLAGCSRSKEGEQSEATGKTATQQATEAIKEYGKRPLDKARAAQQMGEERTKAIDDAIKQK